jgi:hypothetical protein
LGIKLNQCEVIAAKAQSWMVKLSDTLTFDWISSAWISLASRIEQSRIDWMNPPDFSFSERYTLNHQSQLENRLTFSLLSRYLIYRFHSVNPKK